MFSSFFNVFICFITDLGLCSKHDCSDICIPVPEERSYHCMCSEGTGKVLQADGKTCLGMALNDLKCTYK